MVMKNKTIDGREVRNVLTANIYLQIINDLIDYNANFAPRLTYFKEMIIQLAVIDVSELTLSEWSTLYFNFVGKPLTIYITISVD